MPNPLFLEMTEGESAAAVASEPTQQQQEAPINPNLDSSSSNNNNENIPLVYQPQSAVFSAPPVAPAVPPPSPSRRREIPEHATEVLNQWLHQHWENPYPTTEEKILLMSQTGLEQKKVENWFTNHRRREGNPFMRSRSQKNPTEPPMPDAAPWMLQLPPPPPPQGVVPPGYDPRLYLMPPPPAFAAAHPIMAPQGTSSKVPAKKGRTSNPTTAAPPGRKKKKRRSTTGGNKKATVSSSSAQGGSKNKLIRWQVTTDEEPDRLTNPLVEPLPISVLKSGGGKVPAARTLSKTSSTSQPLVPLQASELTHVDAQLVHSRLDTYPLSYLARLLGFEVPLVTNPTTLPPHVPLDAASLQLAPLDKDAFFSIPPLGTFWKQARRMAPDEEDQDFSEENHDPIYQALLQRWETEGNLKRRRPLSVWTPPSDEKDNKIKNGPPPAVILSEPCLEMARARGFLSADDVVQTVPPDAASSFGLTLHNTTLSYQFVWYPLPPDSQTKEAASASASTSNIYGMPSATIHLAQKEHRELVLHITRVSVVGGEATSTTMDSTLYQQQCKDVIVLVALVLEQARSYDVWYGWMDQDCLSVETMDNVCKNVLTSLVWDSLEHHFCMASRSSTFQNARLVCDLKSCSYRYAFLFKKRSHTETTSAPNRYRLIVRLPNVEQAEAALHGLPASSTTITNSAKKRKSHLYTGAGTERVRSIAIRLRCNAGQLETFTPEGEAVGVAKGALPPLLGKHAPWDILKMFALPPPSVENDSKESEDDEILRELQQKQSDLMKLEGSMEPKLRQMMQQLVDLRVEYEQGAAARRDERQRLQDYQAILERRKEMDLAWQKQLEQDMDAVCDICNDGEVTPDNQILFCEACNVAVHQFCYGIEKVPEGDYYCVACRFFEREKMSATIARQVERGAMAPKMGPSALPICCELCPRKQGAFIQTAQEGETAGSSKWVHMVCAKWQGLNFVTPDIKDMVEDVKALKVDFMRLKHRCDLCKGRRGAYIKCRDPDCDKWMHVTCARASGLCEVVHGEDCNGDVTNNPWSLLCIEHSEPDPTRVKESRRVSLEQLERAAKEFPPEPEPAPLKQKPRKVFHKMNGKERHKWLADRDFENAVLEELMVHRLQGVHCEVCHVHEDDGKHLTKCISCSAVFCDSCKLDRREVVKGQSYKCVACEYVDEKKQAKEDYEEPACTLCLQPGGCLNHGYANVINGKTRWTKNPEAFAKSIFGKKMWCHTICTLWSQLPVDSDSKVNCSDYVLVNGKEFVRPDRRCALCGSKNGMKIVCKEASCRARGEKSDPFFFHPTCARQAGLEVKDELQGDVVEFYAKCFHHSGNAFNLRARLEDLIEVERRRAGKRLDRADGTTMSLPHASRLLNKSIVVLQMLGWAWRWAEWWVENGDSWEPLLEPHEDESKMTKEQLKIVDTSPEIRCEDARKSRLVVLSAALRNREYDEVEDGDTVVLCRALRSMLNAKSLVGPLEEKEIDFFVDWLSRAYRSRSRLLGFGPEKIPITDATGSLHIDDKSPKYLLGERRLPGLQELPEGAVFETDVDDVDDFLKPEVLADGTVVTEELRRELEAKKRPPKSKSSKPKNAKKSGKKRGRKAKENPPSLDDADDWVPLSTLKKGEKPPQKSAPTSAVSSKRKRQSKTAAKSDNGPTDSNTPKKRPGRPRGRPRKTPIQEALLDDTTAAEDRNDDEALRKSPGRPRKRSRRAPIEESSVDESIALNETVASGETSNAADDIEPSESNPPKRGPGRPPKRKPGRPRKIRREDTTVHESTFEEAPTPSKVADAPPRKKLKRGRSKRRSASESAMLIDSAANAASPGEETAPTAAAPESSSTVDSESKNIESPSFKIPKRRRGRPPKRTPPKPPVESEPSVQDDITGPEEAVRNEHAASPGGETTPTAAPPESSSTVDSGSENIESPSSKIPKKRRGRPPKRTPPKPSVESEPSVQDDTTCPEEVVRNEHAASPGGETTPTAPPPESSSTVDSGSKNIESPSFKIPKKRRGRPPKRTPPKPPVESEPSVQDDITVPEALVGNEKASLPPAEQDTTTAPTIDTEASVPAEKTDATNVPVKPGPEDDSDSHVQPSANVAVEAVNDEAYCLETMDATEGFGDKDDLALSGEKTGNVLLPVSKTLSGNDSKDDELPTKDVEQNKTGTGDSLSAPIPTENSVSEPRDSI